MEIATNMPWNRDGGRNLAVTGPFTVGPGNNRPVTKRCCGARLPHGRVVIPYRAPFTSSSPLVTSGGNYQHLSSTTTMRTALVSLAQQSSTIPNPGLLKTTFLTPVEAGCMSDDVSMSHEEYWCYLNASDIQCLGKRCLSHFVCRSE